jgi:protein TonB
MILKKAFLLCSFLLFLLSAFAKPFLVPDHFIAQKSFCDTVPGKDSVSLPIFQKVETEASFPGGESAWRSFLGQTLNPKIPAKKKAPKGAYTVWIQFVVDKEGNLSEFKPLTSHGYGMEDEVIRTLKKSPRWAPATQNGKIVRAYRKQPVTFIVE